MWTPPRTSRNPIMARAVGSLVLSYARILFARAPHSRWKLNSRSIFRFPVAVTYDPFHGLPIESTGRAACPLAIQWYELRAFLMSDSGAEAGSLSRLDAPVRSRLMA